MSGVDVANVMLNNLLDEHFKHVKNCFFKPEWISVKDRLPSDGQKILCFNGEINYAIFNENPGHGIASLWESRYEKKPSDWGLYDITHWMPLPEPPK